MRFSAEPPSHSPFLLRASTIRTLSSEHNNPAAFLVKDGIIQHVFQTHDETRHVVNQKEITTIDRPGHCVVPGFGDAHIHLKWLGESLQEPDLTSCSSYDDIRTSLVDWVEETSLSPGDLIHGRGWNPDRMDEQRWPDRSDLHHPTLSEHPVALLSHDHHVYWVNDTLLNELPEVNVSPSNFGGTIHTDQNGQPTGVFVESAIEPITDFIEQKQEDRNPSALLRSAMEELVRNGITCVHDIGNYDSLKAHQTLRTSHDLLPDVCFFCFQESWNQIPSNHRRPGQIADGLEFAGLKLFADGTLGAKTAAMLEPYQGNITSAGSCGTLVNDPETLTQHAKQAAELECSTMIHAIGDRAVRASLDVLSSVYDQASTRYPPRVEHAQLVSDQDLHRFDQHDIVSSMQPCHVFQDRAVASSILGERADDLFPLQNLLQKGTSILFGSDAPVEPSNPLRNLAAAVGRNGVEESGVHSAQRISREQALKFICRTPISYLNHSRNHGMITGGVPSNFVVLSDDPLTYTSGPLTDLHVVETFINGQRVYSS